MTSADPCRMGGIEGVGMVEAEYVGRLLRMVCNLLLMPVCVDLLEVGNLYGSRIGYHENTLLKTNEGQERQR